MPFSRGRPPHQLQLQKAILFRKGLDPGTLPFQNAGSNPNGTLLPQRENVPLAQS